MHTQISHMDSHWPELRFAPFQFNIDLNAVSSMLTTSFLTCQHLPLLKNDSRFNTIPNKDMLNFIYTIKMV
jgi:hypothetical protein